MSWRDRLAGGGIGTDAKISRPIVDPIGSNGANGNRVFPAKSTLYEVQGGAIAIPERHTTEQPDRLANSVVNAVSVVNSDHREIDDTADNSEGAEKAQTYVRREKYLSADIADIADTANRVQTSEWVENNQVVNSAESADSSLLNSAVDPTADEDFEALEVHEKIWRLHRFTTAAVPSGISTMTAQLADTARRQGAVLVADGLTLKVVEHDPLPPEILAALQADAGAIITILRREAASCCNWPPVPAAEQPWDAEDWCTYFEERAAIRQYDGGVNREVAERRAWRETANRWWFELGTRSPANICAGCGKPVSVSAGVPLPHDQRVHDANCMIRLGRRWIAEAAEALAKMGIPTPDGIMPEDTPLPDMPAI